MKNQSTNSKLNWMFLCLVLYLFCLMIEFQQRHALELKISQYKEEIKYYEKNSVLKSDIMPSSFIGNNTH